jgi:putative N-acetylmannosamine-6-phosphate epimerase
MISPLFNHVSSQIEAMIEAAEAFDESVFILESFNSALIKACDPADAQSPLDEFKRVMLVMQTFSVILDSGAVALRGDARAKIQALCDVSNLPTGL